MGWSESGGISVVVPGTQGSGSQRFQQSFVGATITVYQTGTLTLATLYSDNLNPPTAKANPFTASSTTGLWSFYAINGRYDVKFSGAGITSPFTLSDIQIDDSNLPQFGVQTVAYTATPAFDASQASIFQMNLTGNVTSSTITNAATGRVIWIRLIQDATGGRTFAFPANSEGNPPIDTTASTQTTICYYYDGTNWRQLTEFSMSNILTAGSVTALQFVLDYTNKDVTLSRRSGGLGATFARTSGEFTLSIFPDSIAASFGILEIESLNSLGSAISFGALINNFDDKTAASEDSSMQFQLMYAGAAIKPLELHGDRLRLMKPGAPLPSNWESLEFKWESNVAAIYTNATGSGTLRELQFGGSAGSHYFSMPAAGGFNPTNDNAATSTIGSTSLRWRSLDIGTGGLRIGANTAASGQLWSGADGNNETILTAAGTGSSAYLELKLSRGTTAAKTTVVSGDTISYLQFYGYDGGAFRTSSQIALTVDDTVASGRVPGRMGFFTAKTTTGGLVEGYRLDNLQNSIFNLTGSNLAQNATFNFMYLPGVATGTPSGTPSLSYTGAYPLVYDTVNNALCVYNGSWRSVALT